MKPAIIGIILFVVSSTYQTFAQNTIWKKDVTRLVPIDSTSKKKGEPLLVEMLIAAGKKGEITAYSNMDNSFSFPLTKEEFTKLTTGSADTIAIVDPETGKESIKISERVFDPGYIEKFKLREQWQFEPAKGKITIQILGVAPAVDIYGEDGNFRAVSSLSWFKYNDVETILNKEIRIRPQTNLLACIWKDFTWNYTAGKDRVQQLYRTRIMDMQTPDDTIQRHLRDITSDTGYIQILREKINAKQLTAYKDSLLHASYSADAFDSLFKVKADTIWTIDPETGKQTYKIMPFRDFEPEDVHNFVLLEKLTFDPKTGEMTAQIISLAPIHYIWDQQKGTSIAHPMFWVKYSDFQTMLPAYEMYHPTPTFAEKYWNSYFNVREYVK